ncbi:MAG: hypothetical protein E6G94_13870 [Alphaproteobacteria bacterium]|nr:MAG: hypothetical protein E6G94_13870 [Alphaproteobacteria bacterium]
MMLKSIMVGTAMLVAIPALAQTQSSPTGTTTNDHDPMSEEDSMGQGSGTTPLAGQVNGGVTTSSPGMGTSSGTTVMTGQAGLATQGTATAGTTAYQGVGGPRSDYPLCSWTVTDSCRQVARSAHRRR